MQEAARNLLGATRIAPSFTCNCSKALASSYILISKEIVPVLKGILNGGVQQDVPANLAPACMPKHAERKEQKAERAASPLTFQHSQHDQTSQLGNATGPMLRQLRTQTAPASTSLSRQEAARLSDPGLVGAHDQWRMQQLLLHS